MSPKRALRLLTFAVALCGGLASAAVPGADRQAVALRAAFPDADRFESRDVILTAELVARVEKLARARVPDRLVTFHSAWKGAAVLGYAAIHSHVVRTKRETLLLAFEPDGRIRRIQVVAFLEPEEYRPSERWLKQFEGKAGADKLAVGQDVAPISGATLTARGVAEESRWLLQALRLAVLEAPR